MENKYTHEEILKNISVFDKIEEDLLIKRKEINRQLLETRKQKEYWNELDLSQLKIF
jgi:hypothetical protein